MTTYVDGYKSSEHPLYVLWAGMIARCENPNHVGYKNYGAKGVKVCDEWRNSFATFARDMGERPSGASLERIDSALDYYAGNCRWATPAEQSRNTSRNVYIEHDGKRMTVRDWESHIGVKRGVIQRRLELGWPPIDALTQPIKPGISLRERQ